VLRPTTTLHCLRILHDSLFLHARFSRHASTTALPSEIVLPEDDDVYTGVIGDMVDEMLIYIRRSLSI
jgi:hypothetical protein